MRNTPSQSSARVSLIQAVQLLGSGRSDFNIIDGTQPGALEGINIGYPYILEIVTLL